MIIPRIGDEWEFTPSSKGKHKTIKKVVNIIWRPSQVTGRLCPYLVLSHQPKARYIGAIRVKNFLRDRAVRRISSAAEHSVQRMSGSLAKNRGLAWQWCSKSKTPPKWGSCVFTLSK